MARAESVLRAAQSLTQEPLPPARGIAEGNAEMVLVLLAALFRARHGLERAAAALAGHMSQFAQWLEEYDVQVLLLFLGCPLCLEARACAVAGEVRCPVTRAFFGVLTLPRSLGMRSTRRKIV